MATTRKTTRPRVEMGADEARQILGELLDRAGFKGERFVLSRHGKPPIAAIIGIDDLEALEQRDVA